MAFGKRLEELLTIKNINQYELSKITGIGQSTLSDILKGKIKDTTTEKALKISKALGVSISVLLGESDITEDKEQQNSSDLVLAEWLDFKTKNMKGLNLLAKMKKAGIDIKEIEDYVDYLISKKSK